MQRIGTEIILSAHDLVGHLNCQHLTALELSVAQGTLAKPFRSDPFLEVLQERGFRHERDFLEHLASDGLEATVISGVGVTDEAVAATLNAMKSGIPVIVQGALRKGRWIGRADVMIRVDAPSSFGDWSYEIYDTKLSRETKGGTILQLSLYADLLASMQGVAPEWVHVVVPWSDFVPQRFRVADYSAFFRKAWNAAELASMPGTSSNHYPDPTEHCDICRWSEQCEKRRRTDDHLYLVANISRTQIVELQARGVGTTKALAGVPSPLPWKPERGSPASFEKTISQARIQVAAREAQELRYELLELIPDFGLYCLPEPSSGDIFFDIEGDPFIGEHGLEYLFGYHYRGDAGEVIRVADWAFDRNSEKAVFEKFIDFVEERRAVYPDLHIYHYAPYEPGTLKRLMGRYATREAEVDKLLRGKVMVDLYGVVRNAIRASVESYSIKKLEPFYGFGRSTPLKEANVALSALQVALELDDGQSISESTMEVVAAYNDDDCRSTEALRDWLEQLRSVAIEAGAVIHRPIPEDEAASENVAEREARVAQLMERLTQDIPVDEAERTPAQHGRWILAHSLSWHRREAKSGFWEFFRLGDLTANELVDEKAGIGGLTFVETLEVSTRGIPTDRYEFEPQDTDIRAEAELHVGGEKFGEVIAISQENRTIDVKKTGRSAELHPEAVYAHKMIRTPEQEEALFRLGEYVAENGIEGAGHYQAARDLLLRHEPRISGPLHVPNEDTLEGAVRIAALLQGGVLPIQGPPGTGKSHTAAHMICTLIRDGKRVGITANSHKVIRNLIDKAIEVSKEMSFNLSAGHKVSSKAEIADGIDAFLKNEPADAAMSTGQIQLLGGTSFYWAREEATDSVDVLFIDEAAQMSLANALAVSQAAPSLVLLGDPQQLDQPTQGSHPDGVGVSALDYVLQGRKTIDPEQGLFLDQTWRLHPDITAFNSELFYEGKLASVKACRLQTTSSTGPFSGTGLRYVPVPHSGNQSRSLEEAAAVSHIVDLLLHSDTYWTDRKGVSRPLTLEDIIIIAPYNAQVFEIQERIPGAHVGTVDKFQGQEAPIAIFSMATSSHADAPRGMEFLYSANRLNVAISRAKCMAILVASPQVFEAECRTPRQMQLANAFCRYLEMAQTVELCETASG